MEEVLDGEMGALEAEMEKFLMMMEQKRVEDEQAAEARHGGWLAQRIEEARRGNSANTVINMEFSQGLPAQAQVTDQVRSRWVEV